MKCTPEGLARCVTVLKKGGILVYPTDTVYGIGCDPFIDSAVERVFTIKARARNKPLPVLVHDLADADKLVDLGDNGRKLALKFWPGQVTIVAPLINRSISPKVTAGADMLGVRVPANNCLLSLLERCRFLVGTSANISGSPPMGSAEEVQESGLAGFDMLLDGGRIEHGRESTVVDVTSLRIDREGSISVKEIYDTLRGARD